MMNCIIFALYFPDIKKQYVLEEIFSSIRSSQKDAKVFIGIQHNSISETETIIASIASDLNIETSRVPTHLLMNSDASAFIAALKLYSQSNMDFDRCYFIHTKGITSNDDQLRGDLLEAMFHDKTVDDRLANDLVGSYGPSITFTDVAEDIKKMQCCVPFHPSIFKFPVMEYYYIHTFYVIKNHILRNFIDGVSPDFFDTPIATISDRWMFERDFLHIVDMQGYYPAFTYFHGNYSMGYKMPTPEDYDAKLDKWLDEMEEQ